jgi:ATP-binding cassette, subfamily C, bacteriocin exporter
MPLFKQRDATDCGPACLKYVAHFYRLELPIPQLRLLAGTGPAGTTVFSLVEAARQLGFSAKGVKGPPSALPGVPLPAIAHVLIDQRLFHYVVLVAWTRRHVRIMDPATGRVERWSQDRFASIWTGVLVLLAPGEQFRAATCTVAPWRRLWHLIRPHRSLLLQAFAGAAASTLLALSTSIYVQKIVDTVLPDSNPRLLDLLTTGMLVVLAGRVTIGAFQSLLSLRAAQCIDATLILAYYRRLLQLPQPFFDTMRIGEITSRVADAVKIRSFLNQSLLSLLLNPLILACSLGAMVLYSWKLAALSAALLPVQAIIYVVADRINRAAQRQIMERAADFDAQLVESLGAQSVLRQFQLETAATLKTEVRLVRLLRGVWRAAIAGLGTNTAASLFSQVYLVGLLWCGAHLVLQSGLSAGQLMSCYTLSGYLAGPIGALLGLNATIQETLIAADRLFEVMDLPPEPDSGTIQLTSERTGDVQLEEVNFRHPGRLPLWERLTVRLPAGCITVLAGASGSGKSTLLALLQRLYLPEQGRILIGGTDLRYFSLTSLRRGIAVVPQQPRLLSGSVLENIAAGATPPDLARALRICRELGAAEFIEKLPQGFLTPLVEHGANLSGGQRQRLALARALYREAPILLLDEPSSALDAGAEEALLEALRRERDRGATIVLAAHAPRLWTLADQVVTLPGGQVNGSSLQSSGLLTRPQSAVSANGHTPVCLAGARS